MVRNKLAEVPGALSDLLGMLVDAAAVARERSAAAVAGPGRDWEAIALSIEAVVGQAKRIEALDQEFDPR